MNEKKQKTRVFFLGSGKLGIPSLAAILSSSEIDFVGAATQDDKPSGRKLILSPTPIAEWALKNNLEIEKVRSINNPEFVRKIKNLQTDIIFLASFGQILKNEILSSPLREPVNLHASLLPKYRGASPIQSAILSGEKESGISFMRMEKGLDTGPIFAKFAASIDENDNAEMLENKLADLAAKHVVDIILKIDREELQAVEQDHSQASYAPKIRKNDGALNWKNDALTIKRMVRAFYPWPGVFFEFENNGKKYRINIKKADVRLELPPDHPGKIIVASKKSWIVACGNGALDLLRVLPDGKKEMDGTEFLRGAQNLEGKMLIEPQRVTCLS
jgi:methionyl-tRNA formyltransferase